MNQNNEKLLQKAHQRIKVPPDNPNRFQHPRTEQMSFINTLEASKATVANPRRTRVKNVPCSKSPVQENNCTEYLERFGITNFTVVLEHIMESKAIKGMQKPELIERSNNRQRLKSPMINGSSLNQKYECIVDEDYCSRIVSKAVQKGSSRKGSSPSHIMQNERALEESKQMKPKNRQKRLLLQPYRKRKRSTCCLDQKLKKKIKKKIRKRSTFVLFDFLQP